MTYKPPHFTEGAFLKSSNYTFFQLFFLKLRNIVYERTVTGNKTNVTTKAEDKRVSSK